MYVGWKIPITYYPQIWPFMLLCYAVKGSQHMPHSYDGASTDASIVTLGEERHHEGQWSCWEVQILHDNLTLHP